jgi:hypothetical protein
MESSKSGGIGDGAANVDLRRRHRRPERVRELLARSGGVIQVRNEDRMARRPSGNRLDEGAYGVVANAEVGDPLRVSMLRNERQNISFPFNRPAARLHAIDKLQQGEQLSPAASPERVHSGGKRRHEDDDCATEDWKSAS